MIREVSELDIYKESLSLLEHLYTLTQRLPRREYDTVDQIRRAAKSIPANIAEGFGKKIYPREFQRYLAIAMGSSDECVAHFAVLRVTVPQYRETIDELATKYKILSRRINKLRTSWYTDQQNC